MRIDALTKAQSKALAICARDGIVCAGDNIHGGRVERVNANTIEALIRRGLLLRCYSNEGGVAGRFK